jgi:hypothetical protein
MITLVAWEGAGKGLGRIPGAGREESDRQDDETADLAADRSPCCVALSPVFPLATLRVVPIAVAGSLPELAFAVKLLI